MNQSLNIMKERKEREGERERERAIFRWMNGWTEGWNQLTFILMPSPYNCSRLPIEQPSRAALDEDVFSI